MDRWKKTLLAAVACAGMSLPLAGWQGEPTLRLKLNAPEKMTGEKLPALPAEAPAVKLADGASLGTVAGKNAFIFNGRPGCRLEASDAKAFAKWAKSLQMQNISASFYVRVNRRVDAKPVPGTVNLLLDKDLHLTLYLPVKPGEWADPFVILRSREPVKPGKWIHVMFNYSLNRCRASLYLDGAFQMELDDFNLPALYFTAGTIGENLDGALADVEFHDAALNSEDLLPKELSKDEKAELDALAGKALASRGGAAFKAWVSGLRSKIGGGNFTVTGYRNLKRDLENAVKIGEAFVREDTIRDKILTVYNVDPCGQEMLTAYRVPEEGVNTNRIRFTIAQNEYESFSFLAFAFGKIDRLELKISDLRSKDGSTIPSSALDARLVKRWVRAGGAWMTYHTDKQVRLVVPDMLLKDEDMIRVDEKRLTNYLRISYPSGTEYAEISRYSKLNDPSFNVFREPVKDAAELLPVSIPEAGRTQQFYVTLCPPKGTKPGIYQGTVGLTADGRDAGSVTVQVYVLPFDLPEAKTYYDTSREFISWLTGRAEGSRAREEAEWKLLQEYGIRHFEWTNFSSEEAFADSVKMAKKYGFSTKILVGGGSSGTEGGWNTIPQQNRTTEVARKAVENKERMVRWKVELAKKYLPEPEVYFYGNDEAAGYYGLRICQEPFWTAVLQNGGHVCGAGAQTSFEQVADMQDFMAITTNRREWADQWHSVGARLLNYACPFSGPENPYMFRWKSGLYMYKLHYDGWFLLSFHNTRVPWNELAEDPGGDGSYRHFSMVYSIQDGPVPTMAMAGLREALDDIRYATLMKTQAEAALKSEDLEIVREAKRQLAWLHRMDPSETDPNYARQSIIERILVLRDLVAKRKAGAK